MARLALTILLLGCSRSIDTATVESAEADVLGVFERQINPELPALELTFLGRFADVRGRPASIEAIQLRLRGEDQPFQELEPEGAEVSLSGLESQIRIDDMNFDGYGDLRLAELLPAGPDVPYLNWLFDPETGRFERAPWLDELSGAVFDAETGRIRAQWRDGAARYGSEFYQWADDRLVLMRLEVKEYRQPGVYQLTISERRGKKMEVIGTRTVTEE